MKMAQQSSFFWFKLRRQFSIVFLSAGVIAVLPVTILITLTVSVVLRLVVKAMAAVFRPDLSQIFGGKGIVFALESIYTRPCSNILLYLFCKNGPMPVEQFRLQFEQRVLNYAEDGEAAPYEKLRQTWKNFMGFIFWTWDSNFQLNNHIRLYDYTDPELAIPGTCSENDLKRIAGDLLARPWVEGRSPWEILIVQDYRTAKEPKLTGTVAILRIHHGLVDGYSILTMLLRFTDSLKAKRVLPNFPNLSLRQKLFRPLLLLLKIPYDFAEYAVDSFDGPNCWHFLWKKLSRKYHVLFSDAIDVEKMKKIRKKYGVDYNATVYSITCGSIRRMMLDAGQTLPQYLSIFAPFPLPKHPGGLSSHVSATCFKFSPRIESAEERICQIGDNLKSLQEFPTGPTSFGWLWEVSGLFPTCLLRLGLFAMMNTISMSSIPGPDVEIPFVGDIKWTGMCCVIGPGQPSNKVGAQGAMMTMAGQQIITLTVDKTIFEGYEVPTKFTEFINQEIEALLHEKEMC